MERCGRSTTDNCSSNSNNNSKGKEPWMMSRYNQAAAGRKVPLYGTTGLIAGFSWPPRSYSCSFCKREFKSAQALGGHMNVHRRDKARLRQSPPLGPPLADLNPNPSSKPLLPLGSAPVPNLNMPPPPSISILTHFSRSPSSSSASRGDELKTMEAVKALFGSTGELKEDLTEEDNMGSELQQQVREVVRLDLEIGVCGDYNKDDLDLELRL